MKRPPVQLLPVFLLVLPGAFILLTLLQLGLGWTELPPWYWGAALLFGALCLAGSTLMTSAQPPMPFVGRMVRIGAGWGLPFSCYVLSRDALQGNLNGAADVTLSLTIVLVVALGCGAMLANVQNKQR